MFTKNRRPLAVAFLSAATLACGMLPAASVFAADSNTTVASRDFSKLSQAGNRAMIDVAIARSALFDGDPQSATRLIKDAQKAIHTARNDNSAFMKAESELGVPAGHDASAAKNANAIAWLPIGGDVVVQDDFASQPAKAKAVANANAALKKGDRDGAIKALKLADVNVAFNVDVVPLDSTVSGIDQTADLLDAGMYYEAGQVMHKIENRARIDDLDINAIPQRTKQ